MIRFFIFTFLSSLVIIETRRTDFLNDTRYYKRIYSSLFESLNDMSPEQFKVLHRLIDLGVLPMNIREPVNILRNLPARVIYPHPPRNMPQLISIVSTIMELDMEEIKTILKLKYHGALTNNVLSMVAKLNSLTKEQLDIIQKKLKFLSESGDIPDIVKYVDRLKPFGFGHITRIIKEFKLDKIVEDKFTSLKIEQSKHSTEGPSTKISEPDTTKSDLNSIYETESASQETTLSFSSIDSQNSSFLKDENSKPLTSNFLTTLFPQLEENSKTPTIETFSEEPSSESKNEAIESMTTENREDILNSGFNQLEMDPTMKISEFATETTDAQTQMDSLVTKNNQNESLFNNYLDSNFETTDKFTDQKYELKNSDNFEVNEIFTENSVLVDDSQYQFTEDSLKKDKNIEISQSFESTEPLEVFDQKVGPIASKFKKREIGSKTIKLVPGIQSLGHFPFQPDNPNHPPITITESNSKTDTKFENGCMVSTTVTTTITRTFSQISTSQEFFLNQSCKLGLSVELIRLSLVVELLIWASDFKPLWIKIHKYLWQFDLFSDWVSNIVSGLYKSQKKSFNLT
ncbi:hypothetical protein BpHYR1_032916 [Brachionus plicatilis]|uniref:Uncharacterized protein n=1 Tax=Brachionus plicatilis TaxID=10195 RepID=A0A3M7T562_BRAPC|nr:hypothetical protein BpHYR1_032916 [Brachionus plicatilis]